MSLARHSLIYLTGRILTGVAGLISLLVLTRVMRPEAYGQMSIAVSVAALVAGGMFQWLRQSLVQFAPTWPQRATLVSTIWLTFCSLYLLLVVVMCALAHGFAPFFTTIGLPPAALVAVCALSLAQSFFELAQDAVRIDLNPIRFSISAIARSIASLGFAVLAAYEWGSGPLVVVAMAAGYVVGGMLSAPRWLWNEFRPTSATSDAAISCARYGLPLSLTLGMIFIVDSSDRLFLARYHGVVETGIYAAAYNFAQFSVGTLLAGISLASYPMLVRTYGESGIAATEQLLGKNLMMALGVGVPGMTGLVALSTDFGRSLLGNYVAGTSDRVISLVAVAVGLAALRAACFDSVLMVTRRTGIQTGIMVGIAVLNIVLNIAFIPRYGALGAAWSTLASFTVALAATMLISARQLRTPIDWRVTGAIGISSAVMFFVLKVISTHWSGIYALVAKVCIGTLVYGLAMALTLPSHIRRPLANYVGGRLFRNRGG